LFFKITFIFTRLDKIIFLKLWDEFYLQLLENERLPYLNKRKKENIKSKKFNEWIFSNEDKKNILISQLIFLFAGKKIVLLCD
jgi:hypothetical protein